MDELMRDIAKKLKEEQGVTIKLSDLRTLLQLVEDEQDSCPCPGVAATDEQWEVFTRVRSFVETNYK